MEPNNTTIIQPQKITLPHSLLIGLKLVLEEYGLWSTNRKPLTQCTIPGNKPGQWKPKSSCRYASNSDCCTPPLLLLQPDFKTQKGELQETLKAAAHLVIFYPSFHCELNFIEYFWRRATVYLLANCVYNYAVLVRTVPEAFVQIPNKVICNYYQRVFRII